MVQWKTASGAVEEQAVGPGDTIYMPAGVIEHQLLNNSTENIRIAVVGVPPPNGKALGIITGAALLAAGTWFGGERRRFVGPPAVKLPAG